MINAVDRRDHAPAALQRPRRTKTTAIVLHRTISLDINKDGAHDVDDVFAFFCKDPEGVATVTRGGSYKSKLPLIESWRKFRVPATEIAKAFCPYHVLVDRDGKATQALDLGVVGAHVAKWNDRSVGVAVIADPRTEEPPKAMLEGVVDVVAQLLALYPGAVVVDHDFVNRSLGYEEKGCIGARFPVGAVRDAAMKRAGATKR